MHNKYEDASQKANRLSSQFLFALFSFSKPFSDASLFALKVLNVVKWAILNKLSYMWLKQILNTRPKSGIVFVVGGLLWCVV